jgi:hypothetical protein
MDLASKGALAAVFVGWFFMNTFVVSLGALEHGVRFFDMSAMIADPTRLFFGGDTPFHRFFFGLACLSCLAAPLAVEGIHPRFAVCGYAAPLLLIVVCGSLLYWRTSGELFSPPSDAKSLTGGIVHFANDLVHRGSDLVARHLALGAGSYLASVGSAVLAWRGLRRSPT